MLMLHKNQREAVRYARTEATDAANGPQHVLLTSGNTMTFCCDDRGTVTKRIVCGWIMSGDRHCGPKAYSVATN